MSEDMIQKIKDELHKHCEYKDLRISTNWNELIKTIRYNYNRYPEQVDIMTTCKDINNINNYEESYIPLDPIKYIMNLSNDMNQYIKRSWDITYFYTTNEIVNVRENDDVYDIRDNVEELFLYGDEDYMISRLVNDLYKTYRDISIESIEDIFIKPSYGGQYLPIDSQNYMLYSENVTIDRYEHRYYQDEYEDDGSLDMPEIPSLAEIPSLTYITIE